MRKTKICKNSIKNIRLADFKSAGSSGVSSVPFADWERTFQLKSYMNFPILLIDYMGRDKSITAKCYVLWQQLYSRAFLGEGNITISKSDLADRYEISETSVKKYLKELVSAGYLKVTKKYRASQITICLPQKFVELLKAAPSINEEEDFT